MVLQCFNIQQWSEYQEESYLDVHSDHNNNNKTGHTQFWGNRRDQTVCWCLGVWHRGRQKSGTTFRKIKLSLFFFIHLFICLFLRGAENKNKKPPAFLVYCSGITLFLQILYWWLRDYYCIIIIQRKNEWMNEWKNRIINGHVFLRGNQKTVYYYYYYYDLVEMTFVYIFILMFFFFFFVIINCVT